MKPMRKINSLSQVKYKLICLVTIILIGIAFRFYNLDHKIYWKDEVFTSRVISGYTIQEIEQIFKGKNLLSIQEVQRFQNLNPNKRFQDSVDILTSDVHPPLYYILLYLWAQAFGSSITVVRGFSAFASLLSLPCIYYLCIELFKDQKFGYIAMAIFSVLPFQIIYAQEARMYSLQTLTILVSSIMILRAIRINKAKDWLLYSIAVCISIYVHFFSVFTILGQGVYVLAVERFKISRKFLAFCVFSSLGILSILPWFLTLVSNNSFSKASWVENSSSSVVSLLKVFLNNISNGFIDIWFFYTAADNPFLPKLRIGMFIKPALLALIAYSLYYICIKTNLKVWLFVISLSFSTPIVLILRDMTYGSGASKIARYLVPTFIGLVLSLCFLIGDNLFSQRRHVNKLWVVVMSFIIILGILSCLTSSFLATWSNKYFDRSYRIANVINESPGSVLILEDTEDIVRTLSVYHKIEDSKASFMYLKESQNKLDLPIQDFSTVFILTPSAQLKNHLQRSDLFHAYPNQAVPELWQISSR
jgi:uncharacterized membrane protein